MRIYIYIYCPLSLNTTLSLDTSTPQRANPQPSRPTSEINYCEVQPCVNGACHRLTGGYVCTCDAGWTGDDCDLDIDECLSFPCHNGQCNNEINGYTCDCTAGFDGINCQNGKYFVRVVLELNRM